MICFVDINGQEYNCETKRDLYLFETEVIGANRIKYMVDLNGFNIEVTNEVYNALGAL